MLYLKNVPAWERIVRVSIGMAALAFAYKNWGASGIGLAVGLAGVMIAMTGAIGFCPMCAMVGRKLDKAT